MTSTVRRSPKGETRREVLEIIRTMPNLTSSEIHELMPHVTVNAIACVITSLKTEGLVVQSGKKVLGQRSNGYTNSVATYALSDNPHPNVVQMKRNAPTEAALAAINNELHAKIAELQAWKADAIARFPELAVDPIVLTARKLVAKELHDAGDHSLANQVTHGDKDGTLMMRVTIKALQEASA